MNEMATLVDDNDITHKTSFQQKKNASLKSVNNASQRQTGGVSKEFKFSVKPAGDQSRKSGKLSGPTYH